MAVEIESYDFGLAWPTGGGTDDLFVNTLESECKLYRLSFILVERSSVNVLDSKVQNGTLRIKFLLDMASDIFDTKNKFNHFIYTLKDSGSKVVDDPDDIKHSADKSIAHFDLLKNNVPVPFTVVIRQWEPTFVLTEEEKEKLGLPFIIKPATGYARKGVRIIGKSHSLEEMEEVRNKCHCNDYLLQKLIKPDVLDGSPAWFRIFHIFGEITPCWWNPKTRIYHQVTLKDMDQYKLLPIIRTPFRA